MPVSLSGKRQKGTTSRKAAAAVPNKANKTTAKKLVVGTEKSARSVAPRKAKQVVRSKKTVVQRSIELPEGYKPSVDEPFMNELQRLYFRQKLVEWKEDIIRETRATLNDLNAGSTQHADLADRATYESDRALELRARDRQRKLVAKINSALSRIEDGSYGYCEDTDEPISLKRLEARPIATLSLEAQERHERRERVYRGD